MAKKNFFNLELGKYFQMDNVAGKIFTKKHNALFEQLLATGETQETTISFDVNAKIFTEIDEQVVKPKKKIFLQAYIVNKVGNEFEIIDRAPQFDEFKNYDEV